MVEGCPEVGRKATPNHHRTTTVEHHLLDAVLVEALSSAPPHTHTSVWIAQIEFRLIRKQHQTPLLSSPPRMNSRPRPAGSPVGRSVPWAPCGDTGSKPSCTEASPHSLIADDHVVCYSEKVLMRFAVLIRDVAACLTMVRSVLASLECGLLTSASLSPCQLRETSDVIYK